MASITEASLREAITQRLGAIHVEVTDMSGTATQPHITNPPKQKLTRYTGGCGQAFTSLIVSPQFQDLKSLKRHRLVNTALKDEIAAIHAWTAKCQTPQEWDKEKDTAAPSLDGTVGGHVEGTSQ
ncbi:hypothetical protein THARTR1_03226 [Trichoderma harzianum]|uniref:BolA domain-containing protein n=1 Tax=Trichoderma harzianum TaxID=5544 RepID=A0A2K0UFI2_TRIHA|nr:hypothetical protein THARTR1_03226 [Trichoderma harzianum]